MSAPARTAAVAALSPAVRARTILAAGSWLPWRTDGATGQAPYVEQDGTPLVVVEAETAEHLLAEGEVLVESDAVPELGRLRLIGSVWPAVGDRELGVLRQFRSDHAMCGACCGPLRTQLIGVRVDAAALFADGRRVPVDPDDYADAMPDLVIARGLQVRSHLNSEHADELVTLVSRLFGRDPDGLAGVAVDWIDAGGLDLSLVDETGATAVRLPFRVPMTTLDDLGARLHRLLIDAT